MNKKISFDKIILLFVFLYPISPWYITFGPINLVNMLSLLFVGSWIGFSNHKLVSFKKTSFWFWGYMLVYSMQAIVDSPISRSTAYIVSQLIVSMIVYSEVKRRKLIRACLDMLVYGAGFLSATGIIEEITHINIFHIISRLPDSTFYTEIRLGIYRIEASFAHPIVYCTYLTIIAAILVYLIDGKNTETKKAKLYRVIYALVMINALLTMSRSALLVLIAEHLLLWWMAGVIKFSKRVFLILFLSVAIMVIGISLNLPFFERLRNVMFMMLAIFNDSFTSNYSMAFGANIGGIGDRLNLFYWVAETVKGHELFGMGTASEFDYQVRAFERTWNYYFTYSKTSIENEYLFNYYIHGLVGAVTFILNMIGVTVFARKSMKKEKKSGCGQGLTFAKTAFILLLGFAVTILSVRASDNIRIFNIFMCLLFAYYTDYSYHDQHGDLRVQEALQIGKL